MTNLEKAEIIGILLHDKFQRENNYKLLPVNEWTEEICKTINSVKVDKERAFFVMSDSDKNKIVSLKDGEILSKFEVLEKTSEKTGLPKNAELFKAFLGKDSSDYVRFADKTSLTVIFNADKVSDDNLAEYADRCLSDLWLGLSLLKDVAGKKEALRNRKDPASYDNIEDWSALDQLRQICAVQANFTVNKRPESGSDHDIWNELLQNANDHIPNTGIVEIRIGNDGLELEYPDEGFSVRDFVAVCTLGNSGNEGKEKNTEGRKGTGFKSIYNLFRKVTITSNDIECVLEDSKRNLSISDDGKSIKIGESKSGETEKPDYYPIPDFKKAKESLKGKTRIHLTLKNEKGVSDIMKMIFGDEKPGDLCKSFIDQKVFLFLDRISKFSFRVNGNETEFNREEHLEKNYWRKERILDIEKPSHWESEEKKFEIKKRMTVLFPKKQPGEFEIDDSNKPVYCTLPVSNFSLKTPFYMNIPLLELDDSRKSLQTATAPLDLKKWNVSVIESAFTGIKEIFEDAAENKEEGLKPENLYHYFPYSYLQTEWVMGVKFPNEILKDTPFLRMTKNGRDFETRCINYIDINNNGMLFLPDYMYWWFGKCNGVNGFEYEKPFLYYYGTTVDEKDQTVGAHTSIKEKLKGVLPYDVLSYDYFGNIGNIGNKFIEEYLYKKANELSLNLEGTKDDIEKIQKALNDGNKLPFGGLLKKVLYNQKIHRTVFRAFLQYCLGESLDNKSYHCLDIDGEVVLNDYTNINSIIEQLKSFFAESNSPIQFTNGEMEFIKSGFVNLVESPYVEYQRERWTDKISDKKLRLNPEQIVEKLNKNRELLAPKTRELFEDSDLVNNNVETIKEWIDRDEPVLFGNSKNGSTVGITKEIYFCCGNCSFGDFNDRVVGLDSFGETIKNVLGWRLIDTGIVEPELEFYKSIDDISFLLKILEAYKDKSEDFKGPVTEHLLSCDKGREEDFSKLFIYLLVAFKEIQWNEGFKRFIPFCKQEILDKAVLKFDDNDINIQSIGKGLKDRFNDIYSDNIQNKEIYVWGKDWKDSNETLPLKKIIEKRFYLVNDCRTGRQSLYCKAKNKNNESCIVLFTEEAFGTSIRDLYDCKGFSEPNPYVPMNCMPGNMLLGWEDYPALTDVEVEQIKEYVRNNCISSDNEEGLIEKLFSPFVFRTDKLFEIRGYGGESSDEKRCPVCDAVLLAEASSLKIKQISYRPGNKHIDLPLMLCNNCSNAFRYAKDVEWKPGNGQDELAINYVNNKKMSTTSIEFSFPNGLKVKEVRMSYLLRVIWWLLVEDVEEQKQE